MLVRHFLLFEQQACRTKSAHALREIRITQALTSMYNTKTREALGTSATSRLHVITRKQKDYLWFFANPSSRGARSYLKISIQERNAPIFCQVTVRRTTQTLC